MVAKTPSQGGFHALTLAHALMRRAGLPVTLISGMGSHMGEVLIRSEGIGALVFVGGRANGRRAAVSLADTGRRHMLEQEGLNTWGIWDFSQWDLLAQHFRKGFEYAKQRCTAYPRYVVQRRLMPAFLDSYLPVVKAIKFGNPLAVANPDDPLPELDFGPVIHATKAADPNEKIRRSDQRRRHTALPRIRSGDGRFLDTQDTSAYGSRPRAFFNHRRLGHSIMLSRSDRWIRSLSSIPRPRPPGRDEPRRMGPLVASIATDDIEVGLRVSEAASGLQSRHQQTAQPRGP